MAMQKLKQKSAGSNVLPPCSLTNQSVLLLSFYTVDNKVQWLRIIYLLCWRCTCSSELTISSMGKVVQNWWFSPLEEWLMTDDRQDSKFNNLFHFSFFPIFPTYILRMRKDYNFRTWRRNIWYLLIKTTRNINIWYDVYH